MKVVCKNNKSVFINHEHLHYFDLLYNQYCDTEVDYIKYEILEFSNIEKTYNYLIRLLQSEDVDIQSSELCSILMTADFLICEIVVKNVIKKIQNIIRNANDYIEIQHALNIHYKWSETEIQEMQHNDKWCQPVYGCKSTLLKNII